MEKPAAESKQKRIVLKILKVLEKGLSQRVVGEKFLVAKCTVADIWKHRLKITDAIASSESQAFPNKK